MIDLGEAQLGTEARATFKIRNTGDATASSVKAVARSAAFTASTACAELAPGATCDVTVGFRPASTGPKSGRVTVRLDETAALEVLVRGIGVQPPTPAGITVRPDAVDFGRQNVGTVSRPERVGVVADDGVRLRQPIITGARPNDFSVVGDSCRGRNAGPCAISVVYAPTRRGRSVAILNLPVVGREPLQVPLTGAGVTGKVTVRLDPPTVDLGQVSLGNTAKTTVALRNDGDSPVRVVNRLLGGADARDFQVGGCMEPVPAGSNCSLVARLPPARGRAVGRGADDETRRRCRNHGGTGRRGNRGARRGATATSLRSLTAEAESAKGAVVSYQATARDNVDGAVPVECDRKTGDVFPVG